MAEECGGPAVTCRTGCDYPRPVPTGYYSLGVSNTTRFHQVPCEIGHYCQDGLRFQCPEGTYGSAAGLTTASCTAPCSAGYRCPSHPYPPSTSSMQLPCGDQSTYCPIGTGNQPIPVSIGYYTIGGMDETTRYVWMR